MSETEKLEKLLDLLKTSLLVDPADAYTRFQLGSTYQRLGKPDEAQFDPPADFTKYDDVMSLMMSRARGAPPQ